MSQTPRRGRPPEVDAHDVADVAVALFEKRGFERVTMDEIARAAKLSRRTLFRLFPSKADLVWDGLKEVEAAMEALEKNPGRRLETLAELNEAVFTQSLAPLLTKKGATRAKRRLKLIIASPALFGHQTTVSLQQRLERLIIQHRITLSAPADLVSRTLMSVGFSAILWWAESGTRLNPVEATKAAFATLSRGK